MPAIGEINSFILPSTVAPTWSPATASSGIVLSNGNLTATNPASGATDEFVFSTVAATKFYFEVVVNTDAGGVNPLAIGIADASFAQTTYLGGDAAGHSACLFEGGVAFFKNSGPSLSGYTTGNNVGVAVDLSNSAIWWRINGGNWNNNSANNPATNVGGFSISGIGTPVFAAVDMRVTQGSQITAQFSTFSFTAPVGFGIV